MNLIKRFLKWDTPLWIKGTIVVVTILLLIGVFNRLNPSDSSEVISPTQESIQQNTSKTITDIQPSEPQNIPSPGAQKALNLKEAPENYIKYANELKTLSEEHEKYHKQLSDLLLKWPNMSTDEVGELAALTVALEEQYDTAKAIKAPEEQISMHNKFIAAYKAYKDSMPLLRDGLDAEDLTLITQSIAKMKQAQQLGEEANQEGLDFVDSINI